MRRAARPRLLDLLVLLIMWAMDSSEILKSDRLDTSSGSSKESGCEFKFRFKVKS